MRAKKDPRTSRLVAKPAGHRGKPGGEEISCRWRIACPPWVRGPPFKNGNQRIALSGYAFTFPLPTSSHLAQAPRSDKGVLTWTAKLSGHCNSTTRKVRRSDSRNSLWWAWRGLGRAVDCPHPPTVSTEVSGRRLSRLAVGPAVRSPPSEVQATVPRPTTMLAVACWP